MQLKGHKMKDPILQIEPNLTATREGYPLVFELKEGSLKCGPN
jgi:hypothetical protein